ncbi:MAG: efflux RND transporter periplasmic adaptor subunit [Planctomycetota bacterium]
MTPEILPSDTLEPGAESTGGAQRRDVDETLADSLQSAHDPRSTASRRTSRVAPFVFAGLLLAAAALVGSIAAKDWLAPPASAEPTSKTALAAPVEIEPIVIGRIEQRRRFSGSLQPAAAVTVSSKIAGRLTRLPVDISDPVLRGGVIAELESNEFEQFVAQAEAQLAVARASYTEAESTASIAQREFERSESLHADRMIADAELDTARARLLSARASVAVADAEIMRANASLASAQIGLDETIIRAEWESGDASRVVAERFAEEGDTLRAGDPIVSVIELDPIEAVIFATQRDYASLAPGQRVAITTDAFPGRSWDGEIARIAPIFREGSRQARIEISVPNPKAVLKPGMFIRANAVLGAVADATLVPEAALVERNGGTAVFVVPEGGSTASLVPVQVGIRSGGKAEVSGAPATGSVVTLGHQLIEDGSLVATPDQATGLVGTGSDETSANEPGANETGANGISANGTAANGTGAGGIEASEPSPAAPKAGDA